MPEIAAPAHPPLQALVALAHKAGEAILAVKDEARGAVTQKDDGQGPVTEADMAAHRTVLAGLAGLTDAPLVSEEAWDLDENLPAAPSVWFIDPLDGTKDFVAGGNDYAVMIGRATGGIPDVGVVYQPETGVAWAGSTVQNAAYRWHQGVRTDLRNILAPRGAEQTMRVAVSRNHPSKIAQGLAAGLNAIPVKKGSVGLKIGLLVDGGAELYLSASRRIKVWDTCGPGAILCAAGGGMFNLEGDPLRYGAKATHMRGVRALSPSVGHRAADISAVVATLLTQFQPFSV